MQVEMEVNPIHKEDLEANTNSSTATEVDQGNPVVDGAAGAIKKRSSIEFLGSMHLRESEYRKSRHLSKQGNLASMLIHYRQNRLDPGRSRKEEIQHKFTLLEYKRDWKKDLVEFFAAFDPCFITDIEIEDAWTAILRREAWQ